MNGRHKFWRKGVHIRVASSCAGEAMVIQSLLILEGSNTFHIHSAEINSFHGLHLHLESRHGLFQAVQILLVPVQKLIFIDK